MKRFTMILTHLTLVTALAMLVPLIIDMFFNSAMGFVDNPMYKYLIAFCLLSAAVSSALHIYGRK